MKNICGKITDGSQTASVCVQYKQWTKEKNNEKQV